MTKTKSTGERFAAIERREKITSAEMARRLGITRHDYARLRYNDRRPTTAWRIALQAIDEHGSEWITPTPQQ